MLQNQIIQTVDAQYAGNRFLKLCQNRNPHTRQTMPVVPGGRLHPSLEALVANERKWIAEHEWVVKKYGGAGATRPWDDPAIAVVQLHVTVMGQVVGVDLCELNRYIDPV